MRITWYSTAFHPMIGGLEAVVEMLSHQFAAAGHEVTIITNALNPQPDDFPFRVLRRPSLPCQIRVIQNSDVFVHANVSLWGLIPWILAGPSRPAWVATHHGWYCHHNRSRGWQDRLKIWMAKKWALNISVSHAVDRQLQLNGHVIPNPFNNQLFRRLPSVNRDKEFVFLGRLVSDKGADILLDALALLKQQGLTPSLTIIGSGPELETLARQTRTLGLLEQVTFDGKRVGEDLVHRLNEHRILVVPSRWSEPFGLVALEGIACGCAVLGSEAGGLPEAIGRCGMTFPNGDTAALASSLASALTHPSLSWADPSVSAAHLAVHHQSAVIQRYLNIINPQLP